MEGGITTTTEIGVEGEIAADAEVSVEVRIATDIDVGVLGEGVIVIKLIIILIIICLIMWSDIIILKLLKLSWNMNWLNGC